MPETMSPREKVPSMPTVDLTDDMLFEVSPGEVITWAEIKRRTALASGSGDHAELARLAEAATPGPWKGRQPAYSEGASYIESELPCINGLSAWFSVAIVPAPSPEELGYSDGAIDSDANAAFIAEANPATVLALIAEVAALRAEQPHNLTLEDGSTAWCSSAAWRWFQAWAVRADKEADRATEAERKLAEEEAEVQRWKSAYDIAHEQATENGSAANALRGKLAEAVAVIRDVDRAARQAASMNDAGYTVTVERTATHIYGITDAFLSKEAERG